MTAFLEYERYDALGLGELVRRREVHPRELVDAAVARVEARNPALNAVIHTMFERARRIADGPLPDGPLAGVPYVLKDLMAAYAGEPLTAGCRFLATFVAGHDSELVARHKQAGLIPVGKTNTPELGIMGVTEPALHGPTRNPWSLRHTPGGSSGGSAAAVAAGMVPIGHGGDGGGSIRIPSSCCGVFGLKPTRGRNPLGPIYGESWSGLVQEHAITRSVRDSAALLDATNGPGLGAPYTAPPPARFFLQEVGHDPGRLRIAFTSESLFGETTHPDCRVALEDAASLLDSLGHHLKEDRPQLDKAIMRRAYLAIVAGNTARAVDMAGQAMGKRPTPAGFEPGTWLMAQIGWSMSAAEFQGAIDTLHQARRRVAELFLTYDLLLTPTMAHPPATIGAFDPRPAERAVLRLLRALPAKRLLDAALDKLAGQAFEATANTMLFNQTGQPAMSVPLNWNEQGLPIGVQLVARFGEEATLFRLAAQLEQVRPWFDRHPPALGIGDQPGISAAGLPAPG